MAKYTQGQSIRISSQSAGNLGRVTVPNVDPNQYVNLSSTMQKLAQTASIHSEFAEKEGVIRKQMQDNFSQIKGLHKHIDDKDLNNNEDIKKIMRDWESEVARVGHIRAYDTFTYQNAMSEDRVNEIADYVNNIVDKNMNKLTVPSKFRPSYEDAVKAALTAKDKDGNFISLGVDSAGDAITNNINSLSAMEQIMLSQKMSANELVSKQVIRKKLDENSLEVTTRKAKTAIHKKLWDTIINIQPQIKGKVGGSMGEILNMIPLGVSREQIDQALEKNPDLTMDEIRRQYGGTSIKEQLFKGIRNELEQIKALDGKPNEAFLEIIEDIFQDLAASQISTSGNVELMINNFKELLLDETFFTRSTESGDVAFAAAGTEANRKVERFADAAIVNYRNRVSNTPSGTEAGLEQLSRDYNKQLRSLKQDNPFIKQNDQRIIDLEQEYINKAESQYGLDFDIQKFQTKLSTISKNTITDAVPHNSEQHFQRIKTSLRANASMSARDADNVYEEVVDKEINDLVEELNLGKLKGSDILLTASDVLSYDQIDKLYEFAKNEAITNDNRYSGLDDGERALIRNFNVLNQKHTISNNLGQLLRKHWGMAIGATMAEHESLGNLVSERSLEKIIREVNLGRKAISSKSANFIPSFAQAYGVTIPADPKADKVDRKKEVEVLRDLFPMPMRKFLLENTNLTLEDMRVLGQKLITEVSLDTDSVDNSIYHLNNYLGSVKKYHALQDLYRKKDWVYEQARLEGNRVAELNHTIGISSSAFGRFFNSASKLVQKLAGEEPLKEPEVYIPTPIDSNDDPALGVDFGGNRQTPEGETPKKYPASPFIDLEKREQLENRQ